MVQFRTAAGRFGAAFGDARTSRTIEKTVSLPHGGTLSIVNSVSDLLSLQRDWTGLEASSGRSHNVFQSYDWALSWAKAYAVPYGPHELQIFAGYKSGRLVFLLPLARHSVGSISELRWLSEPFGQYGDVLVSAGEDPAPWMDAAWKLIARLKGIDVVRLRHVRADAGISAYLKSRFHDARVPEGAPYMDLSQFADEQAYEQRYSKDQRKRRKKIRKDLEQEGPVSFELLTGGPELDQAIDQAIAQKRAWLRQRNLYSQALACGRIGTFLKSLNRAKGGEARLVASVLKAGDRTISWEIGLRYKNRHHGFITAHDVSLTDSSPARLHMDLSQRRALADHCEIFDLMVPMDHHKDSWSSAVEPVSDFYRPVSWTGLLYGRLYLEAARPLMRYAYYKSSARLRNLIGRVSSCNGLFMQ